MNSSAKLSRLRSRTVICLQGIPRSSGLYHAMRGHRLLRCPRPGCRSLRSRRSAAVEHDYIPGDWDYESDASSYAAP